MESTNWEVRRSEKDAGSGIQDRNKHAIPTKAFKLSGRLAKRSSQPTESNYKLMWERRKTEKFKQIFLNHFIIVKGKELAALPV